MIDPFRAAFLHMRDGCTAREAALYAGLLDERAIVCPTWRDFQDLDASFCRASERLIREVDPTADWPAYVVTAGDVGDVLGTTLGCVLIYSWADLALSDLLADRHGGRRGPVVVLGSADWSIVVHEWAHVVADGFKPLDLPDRIDPEQAPQAFRELLKRGSEQVDQDYPGPQNPELTGHHSRWIRSLAHLTHRAEKLDLWLSGSEYRFQQDYDLSHFDEYREALEPELLATDPTSSLTRLLDTPAPVAFRALWASDLYRIRRTVAAGAAA